MARAKLRGDVQAADDGPSVSEALAAFRKLSAAQKQAALTMLERLVDGRPITEAGLTFLTTCGMDVGDAGRPSPLCPKNS
jgi:hypothetical protein